MRKRHKRSGFTLIELIIVIVIFGIISVIGINTIQAAFNEYSTAQNITEANRQARLIIDNMSRRIRMINSSSNITTATSSQLTFTDTSGNSETYQLAGSILELNTQPLANDISSFSLSYLDRNAAITTTLANIRYVTINFTVLLNSITYSFRTTVGLRDVS